MKKAVCFALLSASAIVAFEEGRAAEAPAIEAMRAAAKTRTFGCGAPFHRGLTRKEVVAAFGAANVTDIQNATDPEGENQFTETVIFDKSPADRLGIALDGRNQGVEIAADSRWTGPLGLHVGSTLADVVKAAGGPVTLTVFSALEYGLTTDIVIKGAADGDKAGCDLWVDLKAAPGARYGALNKAVAKDGKIKSTDPRLIAANPTVAFIWTYYCVLKPTGTEVRCGRGSP
jgi:hypothetical protein